MADRTEAQAALRKIVVETEMQEATARKNMRRYQKVLDETQRAADNLHRKGADLRRALELLEADAGGADEAEIQRRVRLPSTRWVDTGSDDG